MRLDKVIAKTLRFFKQTDQMMTPQNYYTAFCKHAKEEKLKLDECELIKQFIEKLNPNMQKLALSYNIRNIEDLLFFLTNQINHSKSSDNELLLKNLTLLARTLIGITRIMHNKELAKISKEISQGDFKQVGFVEKAVEKFREFKNSYKPVFMNKLNKYGHFAKDDLKSFVDDVLKTFEKLDDKRTVEELIKMLIFSLTPSIVPANSEVLGKLEKELYENAHLITEYDMRKKINDIILDRIKDDNEILSIKLRDANLVLDSLLGKITSMISNTNTQNEDIHKISKELQDIDFSTSSTKEIHSKLLDITQKFSSSLEKFSGNLNQNQNETNTLQQKIKKLESELEETKKIANEDFLTKTLTRRALNVKLKEFDNAYLEKNIDYGVIFLDIDYFKKINDSFGHKTGDAVLASLGKFLVKSANDNGGFVGRYGGEEFMMALRKNKDELFSFAQKIRQKIQKAKFVYQGNEIFVTISCGVILRSEANTQKEMLSLVDKLLYKAKQSGRNKAVKLNETLMSNT